MDSTNQDRGPRPADQPAQALTIDAHQMQAMLGQVDNLARHSDADFEALLLEINETSVSSVPGAQYAGITVIDKLQRVSTMSATNPFPKILDDIQGAEKQGPCLSAAWNQHTILIHDLTAETRWPRYRDAALQETPVRSVMSFRLGQTDVLAALNFYAETADAFDDEAVELGSIFAGHTAVAWSLTQREKQFRSALASRDVIGQAKGLLMERFQIDAHAAFDLMRRLSQERNTKLVDIAEGVVAAHKPRSGN